MYNICSAFQKEAQISFVTKTVFLVAFNINVQIEKIQLFRYYYCHKRCINVKFFAVGLI